MPKKKTPTVDDAVANRQRQIQLRAKMLALVTAELEVAAARVMVVCPEQNEDSFVAAARFAWRRAAQDAATNADFQLAR